MRRTKNFAHLLTKGIIRMRKVNNNKRNIKSEVKMDKKKTGRPRKYNNSEDMQILIDKYFLDCEEQNKGLTMSGLGNALSMSRNAISNYNNNDEFSDTIKKAKQRVEQHLEEKLIDNKGNVTGIIFNLKNNFHWKDKQETELTGNMNLTFAGLLDELKKREKK